MLQTLRRLSHEQEIKSFSPEMREHAVRMVQEHRGEYPSLCAAIESIALKVGFLPPTLLEWVKKSEMDSGQREGLTTNERQQLKALERENRKLRRANEILKLASAFFAQAELDRRIKS
jgi:transposase